MHRINRYLYCAVLALVAISCDKIEDPWKNPLVVPQTISAYTPEFGTQSSETKSNGLWEYQPESWDGPTNIQTRTYAVFEDGTYDPENKKYGEYIQYWSEGDAISLFFTTQNLKYQLYGFGEKEDYGYFELVGENTLGDELSTGYYYSVYPYKESTEIYEGIITYTFPEIQHYNGDSYANGENGMIARVSEQEWDLEAPGKVDLYFKNFCSYLQLRLATNSDITKTVKKITLVANDKTDGIAGKGDIEFDDNGVPVVFMSRSATNQITLDCGGGVELSKDVNSPTKFWFVLPGGFTFTSGFGVTIAFTDNTVFEQSTNKSIGIERSHIKPMATFNPSITIETLGPIRYKYNDPNVSEPFPLKNTFFGEDGKPLDIVEQKYDSTTGEWVVYLSGTLKTIGDNSFQGPGPDIQYIKIDNDGEFTIEDTDTSSIIINNFALYNCTADNIIIYNNVDKICESAFTGSTIKDLNIYGNVTTIMNSAGTGSSIETINITGNVSTIDDQAFAGCPLLQTVNVGIVETIGYRAFYMCSNLTHVNIPGVTYIDMGAFRSCTNLQTITLESVESIEDNAFMDCSSLTSVVISANCTLIGEGAFCNAVNLQDVYCYAVYPPFIKTDNYNSSYAFDNTHKNLEIYIPVGSKTYYNNRNYFKNHTFDDPNIEATVNWWYEEYKSKLKEMQNQVTPSDTENLPNI